MSLIARVSRKARNLSVLLATVVAFLALVGTAVAAAPENDNFEDALDLGTATSADVVGTTAESTIEVGEPQAWVNLAGSVWFKWTASAESNGKAVIIRSCQTEFSSFYGINQVYVGSSLDSLNVLSESATPNLFTGRFTGTCGTFWFRAVSGQTYYIQVGNEDGYPHEQDPFELTLRTAKVPKNDLRRKAISIKKKLPAKVTANLAGAFGEKNEPDFFNIPTTVWYSFKPVKAGKLRLEVCGDTDAIVEAHVFRLGKKGSFKSDRKYTVRGKVLMGNMCSNGFLPAAVRVVKVKKNRTYTLAITQNFWEGPSANKATLKISGNAKLKKVKKKKKKK